MLLTQFEECAYSVFEFSKFAGRRYPPAGELEVFAGPRRYLRPAAKNN